MSKENGSKIGPYKRLFIKEDLLRFLTMLSVVELDHGRPLWNQVKEIQLEKKERQTPNQRRGHFSCQESAIWDVFGGERKNKLLRLLLV